VCVGVKLGDILNENALKTVGESYYYNVVQSHNVFVLKEYVNSLQSIIYTDSKDLYKSAFRSYDNYLFQFIDKMFDNPKKATALIEKEGAKLADRDEDVIMEQADITDLWQ
jgi:hypothetical protein